MQDAFVDVGGLPISQGEWQLHLSMEAGISVWHHMSGLCTNDRQQAAQQMNFSCRQHLIATATQAPSCCRKGSWPPSDHPQRRSLPLFLVYIKAHNFVQLCSESQVHRELCLTYCFSEY